jgi:signal transduction histidine kinase
MMAVSLRTRLFVIVAAVLVVTVVVASLATRQATLVEVREVVTRPPDRGLGFDEIAGRAQAEMTASGDVTSIVPLLESAERQSGRPLIAVNADGRVLAASNRELFAAEDVHASSDGQLRLRTRNGGREAVIEVRGTPTAVLRGANGQVVGYLHALPGGNREESERTIGLPIPLWVIAAVSTGALGLAVVFVVARRVLGPVSVLTAAVKRMESGAFDVRVPVDARAAAGADEIAALGTAFNQMAGRLAENERLRRQMVSDIAHELRSPVTNLRCTLEAMQDGLVPMDRAGVDVLHDETLFLQRLIADLQELALAEAGRLRIESTPVDLGDVARRAAAAMHGPGPEVRLAVAAVPSIRGDAGRLEQACRNLIANARRHTPATGQVVVAVACGPGDTVMLEVRDTGDGIDGAHLPFVFDRFYRADESRSRATGGAGLGLAIVRQIALAHGGSVTAESAGLGKGSRFVVTLPVGSIADRSS